MSAATDKEAGSPLAFRDVWNTVSGFLEDPVGTLTGRPEYFDNCEGDLAEFRTDWYQHKSGKQLPFKGQPSPVDIGNRTHICMHNTACQFGTRSYQRKPWLRRIERGDLSQAVLDKYDVSAQGAEAAAARMALHARFWKVAYHWVGLLNGDILYNNQPTRYTWHGNGSNGGAIGVSAEGKLPALERQRKSSHDKLTDLFIETNRNTLRLAVTKSREAGAPIEWITAHRCYSGARTGDPGEGMWREVVLPIAAELDLSIDYSAKHRSGRPIPSDWDDQATHNFAGKSIG